MHVHIPELTSTSVLTPLALAAAISLAAATCAGAHTSFAAFWVGLGGYSLHSRALEQIGSEADCDRQGALFYYAWFEFYPVDSLLIGDKCGAHTFPYIEVKNSTAQMEHEASTSKIGEDQLFYLRQRGLKTEDAVSMIVNGFCKRVFRELPMEFAVEAQKLLSVSLEGSVG